MIARFASHRLCILGTTILLLVLLLMPAFSDLFAWGSEWAEYKSEHFIIYFHPGIPQTYLKEFAGKCERYYHSIAQRLGFTRFNFWLWENRASIFIYKTKQEYLQGAGQPQWSVASVHVGKKSINTYYFAVDFFDNILPHELSHIILREFIGSNTRLPLWFEEGVACVNERDGQVKYLQLAKRFAANQNLVSVAELDNSQQLDPYTFYSLAASLIIFLQQDYNQLHFVQLCKKLRDGDSFYTAMERVYGISNAQDLNSKFLNFLKR